MTVWTNLRNGGIVAYPDSQEELNQASQTSRHYPSPGQISALLRVASKTQKDIIRAAIGKPVEWEPLKRASRGVLFAGLSKEMRAEGTTFDRANECLDQMIELSKEWTEHETYRNTTN